MADVTKLRTGKDQGPPPVAEAPENTKRPARDKEEGKAVIQFSIPASVADEFGQEAGKLFGFKKGSKSDLFMKLWRDHQAKS